MSPSSAVTPEPTAQDLSIPAGTVVERVHPQQEQPLGVGLNLAMAKLDGTANPPITSSGAIPNVVSRHNSSDGIDMTTSKCTTPTRLSLSVPSVPFTTSAGDNQGLSLVGDAAIPSSTSNSIQLTTAASVNGHQLNADKQNSTAGVHNSEGVGRSATDDRGNREKVDSCFWTI